MHMYYLLRDPR